MVTSVVEARRRAEPTALTFSETDRHKERDSVKGKKNPFAASEEIKMQKGTEQNCQQRLRGPVSKIDIVP